MNINMDVKIISQKLIKPSNPTPSHLQNLNISFLDQLIPPKTVPFIFYYQPLKQHIDQTLTQLEKSLSQILTLYYPLAGRYVKACNLISCNDEGVEYSTALVNGPISQILRSNSIEPKDLNRFVPIEEQESVRTPLVAIQINIFSCGGLAIGLRVTHRIIDAYTFSMFTNGWAKTCKEGNVNNVVIPKFKSGALFPPRDNIDISQPKSRPASNIITKRLIFDMGTISKLKESCRASTTEVLIALICRAQINAAKAKQGKKQGKQSALLKVVLSLRGKAFKKIPENCCGNLYVLIAKKLEEKEEMGLIDIVEQVRRAIRGSMVEYAKAMEEGEDVFFMRAMKARMDLAEESRKGDNVVNCSFSSLVNFGFYEADFGWGKPDWVSMTQRDFAGVSLIARRDGDGVEVWVNMEEEEMGFFEIDPDMDALMTSRSRHGVPVSFSKM